MPSPRLLNSADASSHRKPRPSLAGANASTTRVMSTAACYGHAGRTTGPPIPPSMRVGSRAGDERVEDRRRPRHGDPHVPGGRRGLHEPAPMSLEADVVER